MTKGSDILNNLSSYFSIHNHTELSNLRLADCNIKVEKLIKHAHSIGLKGVAITDHECISSHIKAIQIAKKIKEEDSEFKVALGNEIYLVNSIEEVRDNYQSGITKFPHFVLIAKNKEGHLALRKLSTLAWKNMFNTGKMNRVPVTTQQLVDIVREHPNTLIASSACLGGYIGIKFKEYYESKHNNYLEEIDTFVNACKYLFKDDFYLELQPSLTSTEQIEYNKFLIQLSQKHNIKTIYSTDTHYLTKQHKKIHKAYLNSKEGEREVDDFYATTYMMSKEEMWEYFKDYILIEQFESMTQNTLEIYDKIEFYDLHQNTIVPPVVIPPFNQKCKLGEITKTNNNYEYINKFYNSEHLFDKYLLFKLDQGIKEKYEEYTEMNLNRINTELRELWLVSERLKCRLSSYYLLVDEFVDLMWELSLVGISRGSAMCYYICYLLDITQMNPLNYNIPHWRHLSESRPELPDIDLDTESLQRPNIFKAIKEKYGYDKVLNIITFKTLKPKLAIQVAGKGLDYNNDEIMFISDMIPVERGQQWTLNDCLHGNTEEERKPIKEFINILKDYPNLIETALDLEGLIVGRSSHASGLYVFSNNYIYQNSLMKTPNGDDVTCWSMSDSDYCGALKIDCLTIEALDCIRTDMNMLLEDQKIKWQGSLRDTYNKYLNPKVLDYTSKDMWELLHKGEITKAFQYEGMTGQQALNKINPQSFEEAVAGNSIMRLSNVNKELQPLDKYVMFKNDISLWYKEMRDVYHLTNEEISLMEKHLKHLYGVADTQEVIMLLSMDENISNFGLKEANALRKSVAKKSKDAFEKVKSMFYENGTIQNTSKNLLDYVWIEQVEPMKGYAFSLPHTTAYTGILIQEMNLAYKYGSMYWKCACLSVNAGALGEDEEEESINENIEEVEDKKEKSNSKKKVRSTDYGKIAKAISEMNGIVDSPSINYSKESFTIYQDKILYGLKALSKVGKENISIILQNRPFNSYDDFMNRCGSKITTKATIISLIKSGALDEFGDRQDIMHKYIDSICERKNNFTMANIPMLIENNIITKEFENEIDVYNIYKSICTKPNLVNKNYINEMNLKGEWYFVNNDILDNFLDKYNELRDGIDYIDTGNGYICKKTPVKNLLDKKIINLTNIMNDKTIINSYNEKLYLDTYNQYAKGNISKWEMDSMCFYKTQHELANVNTKRYAIENFFDLSYDPYVNETWTNKKGKVFKRYKLSLIMGTVLDRNKTKHTVELLTPNGVVTCKLYDGAFNHYNKVVSKVQSNGKKKRIEESWFKRGNLILVYGFRMEDQFKPRKYKDSIFQHTIMKINEVTNTGELIVQEERVRV